MLILERIFIIQHYYATNSYARVRSKFAEQFPNSKVPTKSAIFDLIKKFESCGMLSNLKHNRRRHVLTTEKLDQISGIFQRNCSTSTRKISAQLGTSQRTIIQATKLLNMHPYRVNVVQELLLADCPKRIDFCNWLLHRFKSDAAAFDYFFFSDEAWFQLDGFVNSQNYRVWSSTNPHAYVDKALHPSKIGVWCALSRRRIIGPIFFTCTVDSNVYCDIINQFISLLEVDERDIIFQQDGARPHTSVQTTAFLKSFFGNRLVSKGLWPPRSPDLTPLDFFLWGHLKNKVY